MGYKVCVVGGAGGIGQPLALLLTLDKRVSHVAVFDVVNVGCWMDLDHIAVDCKVTGHKGSREDDTPCMDALKDADFVIMPGGLAKPPGFKKGVEFVRQDLFTANAKIVTNIATICAKVCANAHICVITNPINGTTLVFNEVMKKHGVQNPKIYGITQLDTTRAKTFVGNLKGVDPATVEVDVIGGHSGETIVPVLSKNRNGFTFTEEESKKLMQDIKYGGNYVVEAKDCEGSATLSMAWAAHNFFSNLSDALNGENRRLCAIMKNEKFDDITGGYISLPLTFKDGVHVGFEEAPEMNKEEKQAWDDSVKCMKTDVLMAKDFMKTLDA